MIKAGFEFADDETKKRYILDDFTIQNALIDQGPASINTIHDIFVKRYPSTMQLVETASVSEY